MNRRLAMPFRIGDQAARLRTWMENHPEWCVLGASAIGWARLCDMEPTSVVTICTASGIDAAAAAAWGLPVSPDWGAEFTHWLVMSAAMMLPLSIAPVRHVAFRSYAWRRHRAIGLFVAGYLAVWAAAGAALISIRSFAWSTGADEMYLLAGCILMALGWQLTPWKAWALRLCHRTVALSPLGLRADLDCLRFGLSSGSSCCVSCWLIMAVLLFGPHGLLPMVGMQMLALFERYWLPSADPRRVLLSLRLAVTRRVGSMSVRRRNVVVCTSQTGAPRGAQSFAQR
jgi:predicted metal-binding membrane protein